jgi:hypothetical protein
VAEVDIPLPRPRSQIETREDPRFGKLHGELYRLIVAAAEARMGSGR